MTPLKVKGGAESIAKLVEVIPCRGQSHLFWGGKLDAQFPHLRKRAGSAGHLLHDVIMSSCTASKSPFYF